MFWNALIRFYIEIYLVVVLSALINYNNLQWTSNLGETGSSLSAVVFGLLGLVGPIVALIYMIRNYQHLQEPAL